MLSTGEMFLSIDYLNLLHSGGGLFSIPLFIACSHYYNAYYQNSKKTLTFDTAVANFKLKQIRKRQRA